MRVVQESAAGYGRQGTGEPVLRVVATWAETLQGLGDLADAVRAVMLVTRADTAMMVRVERRSGRIRRVVLTGRGTGPDRETDGTVQVTRILGPNLLIAQAGSVWRLSDRGFDPDEAVYTGISRRKDGLSEAVAVVVGKDKSHVDFLELHYRADPAAGALQSVQTLAMTLATCWDRRATGTVQRHLAAQAPRAVVSGTDTGAPSRPPVMDLSNPVNLSRSEFRVCALVRDGLNTKQIARSLSVHEATVRSHLSSIYAKTGASGMVGLIHRLNDTAERALPVARSH